MKNPSNVIVILALLICCQIWAADNRTVTGGQVNGGNTAASLRRDSQRAGKPDRISTLAKPVEVDPRLPNVMLIGDSISIGYTKPAREELKGKANVYRPPTNCGHTEKGLEELDKWLGDKKWDIIHFNWGLHDLKYVNAEGRTVLPEEGGKQVHTVEQYSKNLEQLVLRLKKTRAKLIWATTTPVPEGAAGRLRREVAKYNAAAAKIMQKHRVAIDDLYGFALPRLKEIQRPANVHFGPEGSNLLAEQVAASILKALKKSKLAFGNSYKPVPIDEKKKYGPARGKKIKLFILSGQSNMAGAGVSAELPEEMQQGNDRVLMFENGKWQPLRPLRNRFGPEIAFGHAMAKAWPNETIGIVKQARGGTGILAWSPTWTKKKADLTGDGHKGNLWKALTDKVRNARQSADCEVMGFVWQQGGKDMQKLETGKAYLENLKVLITALRKETGAADLPFILGSYRIDEIPDDLTGIDPQKLGAKYGRHGAAYVLKAQSDIQKAAPPCKMVPLRNLERHPQNVHYNTNGQLDLGKLFAEGYLALTGHNNEKKTK
ncbi:MAG: sialate O-acetylesterase [Planctomycetota bacterium]|jgi:acyl-CoA thioesterase-1